MKNNFQLTFSTFFLIFIGLNFNDAVLNEIGNTSNDSEGGEAQIEGEYPYDDNVNKNTETFDTIDNHVIEPIGYEQQEDERDDNEFLGNSIPSNLNVGNTLGNSVPLSRTILKNQQQNDYTEGYAGAPHFNNIRYAGANVYGGGAQYSEDLTGTPHLSISQYKIGNENGRRVQYTGNNVYVDAEVDPTQFQGGEDEEGNDETTYDTERKEETHGKRIENEMINKNNSKGRFIDGLADDIMKYVSSGKAKDEIVNTGSGDWSDQKEQSQSSKSCLTSSNINSEDSSYDNKIGANMLSNCTSDDQLDIDLMTLNNGYHITYPPNEIALSNMNQPISNGHLLQHPIHRPMAETLSYQHGDQGHAVHLYKHLKSKMLNPVAVHHTLTHESPCFNGGFVVPRGHHHYECVCKRGYMGAKCADIDHCSNLPCKHNGNCHVTQTFPGFKCSCAIGWFGSHCEKNNPCSGEICKNGGECSHDGNNNIECVCKKGFKGKYCENVDTCFPSPCMNGGTCREVEQKATKTFICECPSMHKGALCQGWKVCPNNPCQNGGQCEEDESEEFRCVCPKGFSGKTCEERPCLPNPCINGGVCTEGGDGSFTCVCGNLWSTGKTCSTISPCRTNPCRNNGKCIDSESDYKMILHPSQYHCLCKPPYEGPHCTNNMCDRCSSFGYCDKNYQCVCDHGYSGDGFTCKDDTLTACNPNPCRNNGKCNLKDNDGNFECICNYPFKGDLCQSKDACEPNPCVNGECQQQSDGTYLCKCLEGYQGNRCEVRNACKPNPCQNDGTCTKSKIGEAQCACKNKWTGPICQTCSCRKQTVPPDTYCDVEGRCKCHDYKGLQYTYNLPNGICKAISYTNADPCQTPNPCLNNGDCSVTEDGNNFICKCPWWTKGRHCESGNACSAEPCKNGGTCNEGKGKSQMDFTCNCRSGTSPPVCDAVSFAPTPEPLHCEPNPCLNDGLCTSAFDGFDCLCKPRYTGPKCEVDRCKDCDEHAHCVLGRCICNKGYIGNGIICKLSDSPLLTTTEQPTTKTPATTQQPKAIVVESFCTLYPCMNGGTCNRNINGDPQCICTNGVTGNRCDVPKPNGSDVASRRENEPEKSHSSIVPHSTNKPTKTTKKTTERSTPPPPSTKTPSPPPSLMKKMSSDFETKGEDENENDDYQESINTDGDGDLGEDNTSFESHNRSLTHESETTYDRSDKKNEDNTHQSNGKNSDRENVKLISDEENDDNTDSKNKVMNDAKSQVTHDENHDTSKTLQNQGKNNTNGRGKNITKMTDRITDAHNKENTTPITLEKNMNETNLTSEEKNNRTIRTKSLENKENEFTRDHENDDKTAFTSDKDYDATTNKQYIATLTREQPDNVLNENAFRRGISLAGQENNVHVSDRKTQANDIKKKRKNRAKKTSKFIADRKKKIYAKTRKVKKVLYQAPSRLYEPRNYETDWYFMKNPFYF